MPNLGPDGGCVGGGAGGGEYRDEVAEIGVAPVLGGGSADSGVLVDLESCVSGETSSVGSFFNVAGASGGGARSLLRVSRR